jgi:phycoerythrin-associated linker protein
MEISQFVTNSLGQWKSQRSVHHLAFRHFEAVESIIDIEALSPLDPNVVALCEAHNVDPKQAISPFRMTWEGQSDWDEAEILKGTSVLVPTAETPRQGKLLRDQGYAETISASGDYCFTEDGSFVLKTAYDRASAEEKIWFSTPNLRFRVSLIKTSNGTGVITASFSSEIRTFKPKGNA